jgi:hypothetical protein
VEFRRVPFDVHELLAAYREIGIPDAESYVAEWKTA